MKELREIIARLAAGEPRAVLATLVTVEGSSYRRPGVRMLVTRERGRTGAISGGCLEEDLVERCKKVRTTGRADIVVYDTSAENDLVWGVGQGCQGVIRVLLEPLQGVPRWVTAVAENFRMGLPTPLAVTWDETAGPLGTALCSGAWGEPKTKVDGVFRDIIRPPTAITIFGAGDDAQPLARIAVELGWKVTVADPRPAFTTQARFPGVAALVLGPVTELVARAAPAQGSLAVIMTHRYVHDLPLLQNLLPLPLAYLGLLGPRRRADRLLADFATRGGEVTPGMRERLHAPVGLDLGAESPQEVALSIIAEMTARLNGRDAGSLRERVLPIHG